jgi:hypothetical protein
MVLPTAQRELRHAFLGGFVGQMVSGVIWILSAAVSTWVAPAFGMAVLFFASMLLFPLTQLTLRAIGRPARLSPSSPLEQLATQIAFTVPINFLLVAAATLYRETWFYPASMVVVGAHYLPFMFLYGMGHFGVLGGLLISGGAGIALYGPDMFSLGGWVSAVILIAFAFVARRVVLREEGRQHVGEGMISGIG